MDFFIEADDSCLPSVDENWSRNRTLWASVVKRAIFDWITYRDCRNLDRKRDAESAHAWLFLPNDLHNSFTSICRLLGRDPWRSRRAIMLMTKDDVAKIEHLERVSEGIVDRPIPPSEWPMVQKRFLDNEDDPTMR